MVNGDGRKQDAGQERKTINVVSFFCGCGGLDLGFLGGFHFMGGEKDKLPFKILKAYDNDEKSVQTYKINFDDDVELKDLSVYDPSDTPKADVLIGGFPCQDFSTCGPRLGLKSVRGRLYRSMIRYLEHHKPKIAIGENVPGLSNLQGGQVLTTIEEEFKKCGYNVEVWTLFAPDYGVPQNRKRLFIVATRKDLKGSPDKPPPTFEGNHRSIKDAIHDLVSIEDESQFRNQSQYFKASRAKKGNGQGDEKSIADRPSYTIRANSKSRVQFHYELDRRLTVRECARLQTFPDNFEFPHSATTNVMQIGNAVPPLLGYEVARSVDSYLRGGKCLNE